MHNFNNDIKHKKTTKTEKKKRTDYKIVHMQTIDHAHFRHLTMDNNDTKEISWFSVLSEIVEIIARSLIFYAFSGQKVGNYYMI